MDVLAVKEAANAAVNTAVRARPLYFGNQDIIAIAGHSMSDCGITHRE